jgi:hypothetical protein
MKILLHAAEKTNQQMLLNRFVRLGTKRRRIFLGAGCFADEGLRSELSGDSKNRRREFE